MPIRRADPGPRLGDNVRAAWLSRSIFLVKSTSGERSQADDNAAANDLKWRQGHATDYGGHKTMSLRPSYPRLAKGLAAGIVAAIVLSGVAYAITGNAFIYSRAKPGYFSIHPASLAPFNDTISYQSSSGPPAQVQANGCLTTGVHLPDGAKITGLSVWYAANTVGGVGFSLFRDTPSNGTDAYLVFGSSDDASGNRVGKLFSISRALATVNNKAGSYGFGVCPVNNTQIFYGARINYTYTTAGD
jgi:hypothetical protein